MPCTGPTLRQAQGRQLILRITEGVCFLGHPSPQWLVTGSLLLREPLKVAPFRVSIFCDGRACPERSRRDDTLRRAPRIEWKPRTLILRGRMGAFPVWACRLLNKQVAVRQVINHDAYMSLSNILSLVTCLGRSPLSASSLSPFHPCTPALSEAEGLRTSRTQEGDAFTPPPGG